MNVLLLATGADTAGLGYRMKRALDAYAPGVHARQLAAQSRRGAYLMYPADMTYRDKREAERWYAWADVVHVANTLHAWAWWDRGRLHKRLVLHHHGTQYRDGHAQLAADARAIGALQVVATVDLLGLEPDVTRWLPAAADGAALGRYRAWRSEPGVLRVAHAPTDRGIKGTAAVVAACQQLRGAGLDVRLDLIEGVGNAECLVRKGMADVVVDQLVLGYGVNAVEAWGMGLPVVAGVADAGVRARMLEMWGQLPFADATPDTLPDVLRELANARARGAYAARGVAHFARWHSEAVVARQLLAAYADAGPTTRRTLVLRGGN